MQTLTDTTLDAQAERLYDALQSLIRVYQFRDRDRICCHNLSVTQCFALEAIHRSGPLTLNELAAKLFLDKSTASRVVDALTRKKLVMRRAHPTDGRVSQLSTTAKGVALHTTISTVIRDQEKRLLADFDSDVREAMIDVVTRLGTAAECRVTSSNGCCACLD